MFICVRVRIKYSKMHRVSQLSCLVVLLLCRCICLFTCKETIVRLFGCTTIGYRTIAYRHACMQSNTCVWLCIHICAASSDSVVQTISLPDDTPSLKGAYWIQTAWCYVAFHCVTGIVLCNAVWVLGRWCSVANLLLYVCVSPWSGCPTKFFFFNCILLAWFLFIIVLY
jgi:hypothetical protein